MKPILIFVTAALFAASSFGQESQERRLVDTGEHVVTVAMKGSFVVIRMEAISDFTKDRDNSKPLGFGWDFAGIRVDVNNNNVVDENLDVAFGIRQKTMKFCSQYLIHENASTPCGGFRSRGKVLIEFVSTELQRVPHPVFVYEIPLADLDHEGGSIGLTFDFSDPSSGRVSYPDNRRPRSFSQTIPLNLSEL